MTGSFTLLLNLNRLFFFLLLVAGIGGLWGLAPPDVPGIAKVFMTLLLYTPLLLFIPAALHGSARQLTWLSFVLMFYFCGYVIQLFYPPPMLYLAILRVALVCALFTTSLLLIRSQPGDR